VVPRYGVCLLFVVYFRRQILMSGYQSGNMAGEMWVQWFSCCVNQPAAQRVGHLVRQLHFVLLTTITSCTWQKILAFQNHCFVFATTFIAVSFHLLVLLLVPSHLCGFRNLMPLLTSKFCFWYLVSHVAAPLFYTFFSCVARKVVLLKGFEREWIFTNPRTNSVFR
jgi:hypothetical protein